MTNLKELKSMVSEPASKEWFKKHGSPKLPDHKAKGRALDKMKNHKRIEDKKETDNYAGKGTFAMGRSIAKHNEKLGVPHQGRY